MNYLFRTGISQESGVAFLGDPSKSGAGASVGGASIASELQTRGLALYGPDILKGFSISPDFSVIFQTPLPYQDYVAVEQPYQTDFYDLPTDNLGKPIPYDEMVDTYLNRDGIKNRYRELLQQYGTIIDISHFYVEAAVRGALLEELAQEKKYGNIHERIIQITHFHSSPDFTIRADSPEFHQKLGTSWERRMYEIATMHTSIVQFSTEREREMTARAYDGVHGLTYNHIMSKSFVAPLPINTEAFVVDDPSEKRITARRILEIPEDALVYGMVSRIDTEKGYDTLISNFREWIESKKNGGMDVGSLPYLAVIGGIPGKNPRLKERADEIKKLVLKMTDDLRSHIIFPCKAMRGGDVFHAFDAYFGPSETETLHLAPKEAGLCEIFTTLKNGELVRHGIPAFLSRIAAHIETHPDGSAYLFDQNSKEEFFKAFEAALDPQQRIDLGIKNAENSKRYSLQVSTLTFITKLMKVLIAKNQAFTVTV